MVVAVEPTPSVVSEVCDYVNVMYAGRFVESMLYDVTPRDPATLLGVSLLLAACAGVGVLIPARRAAKVEPVEALRAE